MNATRKELALQLQIDAMRMVIDDYFEKRDVKITAGYAFDAARKNKCSCSKEVTDATLTFEKAIQEFDIAFESLRKLRSRDSRGIK